MSGWIPHSRPPVLAEALPELARLVFARKPATGALVARLEAEIAARTGRSWAVVVDSGTSALALALQALDVRRVALPAYACPALAAAARIAGASPMWLDHAPNLRLRDDARARAARADAVVLVHPFGYLEPAVAEDWPVPVVEDIAQAPGADLQGTPTGGFGLLAVGSLYATKPWGGAMGGFVAGDDERLRARVLAMRSAEHALDEPNAGPHRLSDVHAALALARIMRAGNEARARKALAEKLDAAAGDWAVPGPRLPFRWIARVRDAEAALQALHARKIQAARPVPRPLADEREAPGAWALWRACVSVPLLADARPEEVRRLVAAVEALCR